MLGNSDKQDRLRDAGPSRGALRPALERATPIHPDGIPTGDLYLLLESKEFSIRVDDEGREIAELGLFTVDWKADAKVRLIFGVKSYPGYGERVLITDTSGKTSTQTCKPPKEPGVAWSEGQIIEDPPAYLDISVCLPRGDLSDFAGIIATDDPDFTPTHSIQSEDDVNALFADISGRTQIQPSKVEAGSTCTLRGTYTVGRQDLAVGEEITFLVPNNGWSPPQIRDATGAGYLTIHNTGRGLAEIQDVLRPSGTQFQDYWRIEVVIRRSRLVSGDQITVVHGDTSRQGAGTVAPIVPQVMGELTPRFRTKLLPPLTVATDRFRIGRLTLTAVRRRHMLEITPGEMSKFLVIAPSHAVVGTQQTANVIGVDKFNNPATPPFRGAVRVDIDGADTVPSTRETFAGSDSGIKSINWTPVSPGIVHLMVDDTTGRTGVSNPILCLADTPTETVYWGDVHCFSKFSGGLRTPAETLSFAKDVAFLDFCAVSDAANCMTERQWQQACEESKQANHDGEFVSLLGYQSSDSPRTDRNLRVGTRTILTSGDSLVLRRQDKPMGSLLTSIDHVGRHESEIVIFANHPLLDASWKQHEPKAETAVEIYSSFGSSEIRGGSSSLGLDGQGISVDEILATGAKVGFLGCSAGYEGTPGLGAEGHDIHSMHAWRPFRNGLTAVLADDLTAEALIRAIRHRKTFVTTGSRTLLEFHMNDSSIGDIVEQPLTDRRIFRVRVTAQSDLRRVEIIRNGEPVVSQAAATSNHAMNWEDLKRKDRLDYYYLRVSLWDGNMAWTSPIWVQATENRTTSATKHPSRPASQRSSTVV